jgi:predicted PhzF superfamily epimerase YddE/YHI9
LPPQVVSTGTPHLLVPVVPSALAKLRPDERRLREILAGAGAQGCYVFAPTPGQRTAATALFFSPAAGIPGGSRDGECSRAAGVLSALLRSTGRPDRALRPGGRDRTSQRARGRAAHRRRGRSRRGRRCR